MLNVGFQNNHEPIFCGTVYPVPVAAATNGPRNQFWLAMLMKFRKYASLDVIANLVTLKYILTTETTMHTRIGKTAR